jgi:hypothetical protein
MKQKAARISRHAAVAALSEMQHAREIFDMPPTTDDAGEDKAKSAETNAEPTAFGDTTSRASHYSEAVRGKPAARP